MNLRLFRKNQNTYKIPTIRYPVVGNYVITQGFGENPGIYKRFFLNGHNGIDFKLPLRSPVFAVDNGNVIVVGYERDGFGRYVLIAHDWGETLYAHLDEISLYTENFVIAGSLLGLSGNTGFSTGPHLHFGIKPYPINRNNGYNGYVDPVPYLDRYQGN